MAINRPNNRFLNRAFRLQASTSPAIEHLSFASDDSCTESTPEPSSEEHFSLESCSEEPSSLEQAMIQQQAMKKEAPSPHTPSSLPADADATATGTDILYPAGLQPQPVEWLWQHRQAAGTLLDDRIREDGNFHLTGLSDLTLGDLFAPRPTGAGPPKRKFAAQWLRDCLLQCSQTQSPIESRRARWCLHRHASPRQIRYRRPTPRARCSNQLLEHLEHLHETNDLFGNLAKSHSEGK